MIWFILFIILVAVGIVGIVQFKKNAQEARTRSLEVETKQYFEEAVQRKTLPVIQTDVVLKKDEHAVLETEAGLYETRAVRRSTGSGAGFKIAKGIMVGGYGSVSESTPKLRKIDEGRLTLTNQRLIFVGTTTTREAIFNKLIEAQCGSRILKINLSNRQKAMIFKLAGNYLMWKVAFQLIVKGKDLLNIEGVKIV